ncbi:MAG TPA: DsbA family protein [Haliangium sp.]|nr:DsbA family protein [Haliangium sp.]
MKSRATIVISRSALSGVLAGAVALGACASRQATERLTTRVENLETRDARTADTAQRLARIEAQSEQLVTLVAALSARLDGLDRRLEALAAQPARPAPIPSARPAGPDPATVYAVPLDDSPFEGPADARVTIVEAYEFACPFCERARATMAEIRRHYGSDVRIVYRQHIVHPTVATIPAQAACAAHMQGKFMAMQEAIWEKGFKASRDLGEENMLRQARALKLNMRRFEADMRGPCVARVQQDHQAMARVGVRGTPSFFINGRFLSGAQPFENFRALIDAELAKANEIIRTQGVQPRDYYDSRVLGQGRREL